MTEITLSQFLSSQQPEGSKRLIKPGTAQTVAAMLLLEHPRHQELYAPTRNALESLGQTNTLDGFNSGIELLNITTEQDRVNATTHQITVQVLLGCMAVDNATPDNTVIPLAAVKESYTNNIRHLGSIALLSALDLLEG